MNKNDEFELDITDLSDEGTGIGKKDGFVYFVKDAVPGDHVLAAATKLKKNYGFARIVKVLRASPDRVQAPCLIARQCGGCQLQQMSYEAQLRFKEKKVYNNLLRIGEVPEDALKAVFEPIVGMENPFRYRNKAQFPVAEDKSGNIIMGFYAGRTHAVIPCEDCLLGAPENKLILETIRHFMLENHIRPYNEVTGKGLVRHVLIRKGFSSGELMVCLVINGEKLPQQEKLVEALCKLPFKNVSIKSISLSINTERTNVIMGRKIVNLYGPGYIEDTIGDVRFRISPLSFYQVNPVQTEKMYGAALEFADLHGTENIYDLYCGIGTISLFMSKKAKHVYGVEIVPDAIRDAKQNASINGITNADFSVGAAEEVLPAFYEAQKKKAVEAREKIDVISVDPPRKGCDEACLEAIVGIAPEKIVYVSCDSATLARDIKYLRAHGYDLKKVRPVDNFPETVHVETCCLLERLRNAKNNITFTLEMEEYYRIKDSEK